MQLAIIVPCYNEEAVLAKTVERLNETLSRLIGNGKIAEESRVYFVDDGSTDKTWELIEGFARNNSRIRGIKLAKNVGHQNALLAGLFSAKGDAIVSIDADLQDDVGVIEEMAEQYLLGAEIVYAVRRQRSKDSVFKRLSAKAFYQLLLIMGVQIVNNHADFRLMSRNAVEALKQFREVNLFLRGIVPTLGFSDAKVYFDRQERVAGESKYPLRKMLSLALNGITSFSVLPLRLITILGILFATLSMFIGIWAVGVHFMGSTVPGWTSTVVPITLIGGVQLLSLGIVGEYLGKVYQEVKARPRFIIEKII